mgnify:FL=1
MYVTLFGWAGRLEEDFLAAFQNDNMYSFPITCSAILVGELYTKGLEHGSLSDGCVTMH